MTIKEMLLTPNQFSRPEKPLSAVKGLVIHYVANKNTTAAQNRNFFENRKDGKSDYGSAHYIIGLKGEVIRCIPENEMAYHVGAKVYKEIALKNLSSYPNDCTIGIECCHINDNGVMNSSTYESLVSLTTDLCRRYNLDAQKDVYLHYDVTGKNCHRFFVENSKEWDAFKKEVYNKT